MKWLLSTNKVMKLHDAYVKARIKSDENSFG